MNEKEIQHKQNKINLNSIFSPPSDRIPSISKAGSSSPPPGPSEAMNYNINEFVPPKLNDRGKYTSVLSPDYNTNNAERKIRELLFKR